MKNLFALLLPFAAGLCALSAPAEVTMSDIWRWGLLRKAETNGWELGSHAGFLTADPSPYPVFRIPLGEHWTDFEIKASTNNFAGPDALVYYYQSWTAEQHPANPDSDALVYFTDDYAADVRAWALKTNGVSVSSMLSHSNAVVGAVYFYPSRSCACPWMRRDNTNLVWSYLRVDDAGYEKNFDGTRTRWHPIRPASWEAGRTAP